MPAGRIENVTDTFNTLFEWARERRRDTEECQINTGWNISPVGFCDPGIYVPFKRWIFVWFSCCSGIFSCGAPGCCTGETQTMFWNLVRIESFFFILFVLRIGIIFNFYRPGCLFLFRRTRFTLVFSIYCYLLF